MDKIYLKVKVDHISLNLQDNNWCFFKDTLLIIEKVGEKVLVMNDGYGKETRTVIDVWRLNEVRYNKLVSTDEMIYEPTILKPNLISAEYRGSNTLWTELSRDMRSDVRNMIFDDVSVEYIRDEKLEKLIK